MYEIKMLNLFPIHKPINFLYVLSWSPFILSFSSPSQMLPMYCILPSQLLRLLAPAVILLPVLWLYFTLVYLGTFSTSYLSLRQQIWSGWHLLPLLPSFHFVPLYFSYDLCSFFIMPFKLLIHFHYWPLYYTFSHFHLIRLLSTIDRMTHNNIFLVRNLLSEKTFILGCFANLLDIPF